MSPKTLKMQRQEQKSNCVRRSTNSFQTTIRRRDELIDSLWTSPLNILGRGIHAFVQFSWKNPITIIVSVSTKLPRTDVWFPGTLTRRNLPLIASTRHLSWQPSWIEKGLIRWLPFLQRLVARVLSLASIRTNKFHFYHSLTRENPIRAQMGCKIGPSVPDNIRLVCNMAHHHLFVYPTYI